ncbi:dystonin-like [Sparus aurata]|uniref:dystonin-like n=1 Tax=Sparus aurata TaxID=8175 RepID=UPI0011C1CD11|nr:dystonin-like [Sparus aurata]
MSGLIGLDRRILPEAHPVTSNLCRPDPQLCLDRDDPVEPDLTYKSTLTHLLEWNESSKCIESSHVSSVSLSDIAAAREGAACGDPIIKMIEVEQGSDGLTVSYTGDTLTLEGALQCGLIPASVYVEILRRQTTCLDVLEPVQEVEPCEVNTLILKCLSRNKSLTSGRDVHTLRSCRDGLSDQEAAEASEDIMSSTQIGDKLKVDAAVQCDLMSSSSTLTVIGNQQQFIGLVLPTLEESVSTSFQYDQRVTSDEFTSRLFLSREKIAAFYIPENSEVVDINSAVQGGFIDSYTAEILKSIVIPDVFPDVDRLNEKFSSWLIYKKLIVDGCYHAAASLQVDNFPTRTEARQLFISYLMINSFIDPQSGQRVLILDSELSKMIKIFLEDSTFSEKSVTSLTLNVRDLSEQVDLESPLHINEEPGELMTQHSCDPHSFVSSVNGRISFDERMNDTALEEDPVVEVFIDSDTDMDTADAGEAEKSTCQDNTNWTKSGEFAEGECGSSLQFDVRGGDGDDLDIPVVPHPSVFSSSCSVNRTNVGSPSMFDSCHQTPPRYDTDSLYSESEDAYVTQAEYLCSDDLMDDEDEQDYAIHLLKAQMEEGGILDVTSGRRYDLEAALSKGMVDERTVLTLLDMQSDGTGSVVGDEEGEMSEMSDGASNITICLMEQQSLSRSSATISIRESLQSGLVKDEHILYSDPEGSYTHSISHDHNLGFININEAGNSRQTSERKVAVVVLDLPDEEADDGQMEGENVGKMSNYLHHFSPSVGGHQSQMISPSPWSQVTAESVHHALLAGDDDSQGVIDSRMTDAEDVFRVVIESAAPTTRSDRTSSISTDPEIQTQYSTVANYSKSDSLTFDEEFFVAGYDAEVGSQTISESELQMSSSNRSASPEESRAINERLMSAVPSPLHSGPTPSGDYSSPRDLVESAIMSDSRGYGNYDNNITEDDSGVTLPQRAALNSESSFSVELERGCSQNSRIGQRSPQSPGVTEEVAATNTVSLKCSDVKDSEGYTPTNTRVSREPVVADKHLSGSDDDELRTDVLSPESQHRDIFLNNSDTEQFSTSGNARTSETSDEQNADICGKASEMNEGHSEAEIGEDLEEKRSDLGASEHPRLVTDFLSDGSIRPEVSSPAPSVFSDAVRTRVDDQGETTEGTDVSDLQKAQPQDLKSTMVEVQDGSHETETPHGLMESSHLDLEVAATNTISRKCLDVEDSEQYTPTNTRVYPEQVVADKHLSGSDDDELSTDVLSPESQHRDVFLNNSDTEQFPTSRNARTSETSDEQNADICGKASEMNKGQSESEIGAESEEKRLDFGASEHSRLVTDFLSDGSIRPEVSSPAPSVFSDAMRTRVDDQGETTEGTDVSDLQKAQPQNLESTIVVVQNPTQPSEKDGSYETETPHRLMESSHLDLEVAATNTISEKCLDVEDSERYTPTNTRVSLEPVVADEHVIGSNDDELSTDVLSPESQHRDVFLTNSDTGQIPTSRNARTSETSDEQNADICGKVSEINEGHSEAEIGEESEEKRSDLGASEHPRLVTDFLSDGSIRPEVSSPAPSVFSDAVRTRVDDQGETTEGTDVSDLQKAQPRDLESTIIVVQNPPQPSEKDGSRETETPHGLIESSHPDLLMDLLKQNILSLNNEDKGSSELILEEEKVSEESGQSDAPNVQLQLLQVLKTVSSSQDLSVLQEVMETLNSALGGDPQEERRHVLESIKEESSEGEDVDDDKSDACKVEQVKNKLYSIQDYLECVGRLQDHADALDDVRKDLSVQPPVSNSMEEMQIQAEECQTIESQLSRLAGVLTADMEKAKQLLNSVDEGIPIQIHQDLAATYLDLEPNFTAVSQMCAERSQSLIQAMETGKEHLESTYQKHLSGLEELAGIIQNSSETSDADLNTCDADMLKHLIQQNKDTENSLLKEARLKLEDATFDIQCFISEHTQFLTPAQSSYLLKFLSTTQRAFRDQTERLVAQRSALDVLLDNREREDDEKAFKTPEDKVRLLCRSTFTRNKNPLTCQT